MEQKNNHININPLQEIEQEAPFLARVISKLNDFKSVDVSYFDFLEEVVIAEYNISQHTHQKVEKSIPTNYFERLENQTFQKLSENERPAKKVNFRKIWLNVAAVFIFLLVGTLILKTVNDQSGNTMDQAEGTNLTAFVNNLNEKDVDLILNELTSNEDMSLLIKSGLVGEDQVEGMEINMFDEENADALEDLIDWQSETLMN